MRVDNPRGQRGRIFSSGPSPIPSATITTPSAGSRTSVSSFWPRLSPYRKCRRFPSECQKGSSPEGQEPKLGSGIPLRKILRGPKRGVGRGGPFVGVSGCGVIGGIIEAFACAYRPALGC